jgi:hypothetical protein
MRSGLTLGIAALALALGGCDQVKQLTGLDQSGTNTATGNTSAAAPTLTAPAAAPPGATPAKPAGTTDPALEAEMTAAAAQISGQLPIQVDAITRVVAVRAEGSEFVYDLQVTRAVPAAQVAQMREVLQRTNQTNICNNQSVATFIARGGSMNHRYTDAAGNRFETRVVSCP